jgi:3-deoxy-manno-octulosonate cytidylyltransferase (CMP-KDO synthetase)
MKVLIVIPSRYGSTRFEGKPLIDIQGKSLVKRTYLQALKTNLNATVIVATDDQRIFDHVSEFGLCIMTSDKHLSGTDRCFEVYEKLNQKFDLLINLQGDEPFVQPQQIEQLAQALGHSNCEIATLKKSIESDEELFNPNVVKVINDSNNKAIYFSRHPIPYCRGKKQETWRKYHTYFRHIGLYGFRTSMIDKLKKLESTPLENMESLEQLRWIENKFNISVLETNFMSPAIDSPDDMNRVFDFLKINPDLI